MDEQSPSVKLQVTNEKSPLEEMCPIYLSKDPRMSRPNVKLKITCK